MHRTLFLCVLLFGCSFLQAESKQNFISYEFSGGRFGDNLIAYLHAKWVSYKYQIPLLYKPFPYSSELVLHDKEILYSEIDQRRFRQVSLAEKRIMPSSKKRSKVYMCPYFPECSWERKYTKGPHGKPWFYFDAEWKDPVFRKIVQAMVMPKRCEGVLVPPKTTINIAIHFRHGGTHDTGDCMAHFITKFPPVGFYVEGLKKTIELFPNKNLYCYLFTDAQEPKTLLDQIRKALPPDVPVTFDCRQKDNSHSKNVLEDFFSLFGFDVLIHPQSNFSLIPPLLKDYVAVYAPISGRRVKGKTEIDKVRFEVDESLLQEVLLR